MKKSLNPSYDDILAEVLRELQKKQYLDPVNPNTERFDDTKTPAQQWRDSWGQLGNNFEMRTPEIVPREEVDPFFAGTQMMQGPSYPNVNMHPDEMQALKMFYLGQEDI